MEAGLSDHEARRLVRLCQAADRARPAPRDDRRRGGAAGGGGRKAPAAAVRGAGSARRAGGARGGGGGREEVEPADGDDPIERAEQAATEAWETLHLHFYPRVLGFCRRVLPEKAEDLASDIMLRARFRLDRFDASRPFAPWLLKTAANRCWDETRRARRFEPLDDEGVEALVSETPTPLEQLISAEDREQVQHALGNLPARQRFALTLRYGADLSYDEIAATLGVTRTNVGVLLLRGRRRMRRLLSEGLEGGPE